MTGDYLAEEPFCTHQPRRDATQARTPAQFDSADDSVALDAMDRRILAVIQSSFPAERRPFDHVAREAGCSEAEVLRRTRRLSEQGIIRRLGAVFDSAQLGYVSTLVAARVDPARRDEIAAAVSRLPGVTHNYGREGLYNLWFTLTTPSPQHRDRTLRELAERTGAEFHSLPAGTVYKLRVDFPMDDDCGTGNLPVPAAPPSLVVPPNLVGGEERGSLAADGTSASGDLGPTCRRPLNHMARHSQEDLGVPPEWSEAEKALVRELQEGLPLEEAPFDAMALRLGLDADQLLAQVRTWLRLGVIRRLGAVLRHQRIGLRANGMAVFQLPPERLDAAGAIVAAVREVSHCYSRPPLADFPFNLYAMVHGRDENEVRAIVQDIQSRIGAMDHQVLFSSVEYKKDSMRYFVESQES